MPPESSIVEVSAAFVDAGTRAQHVIDEDLINKFSLKYIDHDDFDRLWEANKLEE
jgi:hypothetical protein